MILCIHFSKVSAVNYQKTDKSPRLPMLFVCFCTSQTLSWCSFAVETAIYRTLLMLKCWAKMWFLWIALVLMKWWGLKNARKYTHQFLSTNVQLLFDPISQQHLSMWTWLRWPAEVHTEHQNIEESCFKMLPYSQGFSQQVAPYVLSWQISFLCQISPKGFLSGSILTYINTVV